MYFSVLLLQPKHPFLQKEQKHIEVQLFCADITIIASYLFEEMPKSSDLDQRWMDGWIKILSKRNEVFINNFCTRNSKYLQIKKYLKNESMYK